MKQHDFRQYEQYYPICVKGVSYMYEPFTQKIIRMKDMKSGYLHSTDGDNVTISSKKKENCVYRVRWNKNKLVFLWNMTTHEIFDVDTKEKMGTLQKSNKKWKLNINN